MSEQQWAAVLAGEDAAVFAYGLAGARLQAADRSRAQALLEEHRRAREAAAQEAGSAAAPPAPAYELPAEVRTPQQARAFLAGVENALVAIYASAAAKSDSQARRRAARAACDCAVRAIAWGAPPQAFPT